tara:strand:- start:50 stop:529 length:480 start_codon:yes stop_codon:yes gene_type:complete
MIIECINCSKKFDVNSDLIPSAGRTIQCGSCNHIWFHKKNHESQINLTEIKPQIKDIYKDDIVKNEPKIKPVKNKQKLSKLEKTESKGSEIVKYKPKSNFTLGKLLSYIVVVIISFTAIILILDTFKIQLYELFPKLEFFLFSLYETLKDIQLFIKDLI